MFADAHEHGALSLYRSVPAHGEIRRGRQSAEAPAQASRAAPGAGSSRGRDAGAAGGPDVDPDRGSPSAIAHESANSAPAYVCRPHSMVHTIGAAHADFDDLRGPALA